jgi:hypothetical protein
MMHSEVEISNSSAIVEETPTDRPTNALAVEVLHNLSRFPHCILLTRVGQFYEVTPNYWFEMTQSSLLLYSHTSTKPEKYRDY